MTPEEFSAVVKAEAERMARGEFTSAKPVETKRIETVIPDCDNPYAPPLIWRDYEP